ncbi:Kinetochore protein Nuf2 [Lonchura striata]|uniref:Kinetochore protein Nuf2 n=1 Tax=Lonchura striata TaxID=40157 RepID=A0A218V5U6_9PASE|nr:Kinetochore protein Nuf2 [Lonchura striata domestica]
METMTFPRYSPDDIISYLRSHILQGNEARNLVKGDVFGSPRLDVLHMIYLRILQKVCGIRLEHAYMMPLNVDIMYPQIYEGFLPVCNLYIHMESLLPMCRISDFQIADVLNPKTKRTVRFLSGILNFVNFREFRREAYLELQMSYVRLVPVEHEEEIRQLTENIRELEQLLRQEYRRKQTALQEVTSQKKTYIAERTQKLNECKVSLAALKEEQAQLKSQIVESPEEGKKYNKQMKETIEKLKRSKQEVTAKYERYRDVVEVLPSCQMELQLCQKKMEIQGENVERLAIVSSEARNLEDQLDNAQLELKKANTDETCLKRVVTAKHEKLATAGAQLKKMQEDIEQHKCTVLEHFNEVQEKRGAVYDKVMAIRKEIKQTKDKIEQLKNDAEEKATKAKEIQLILKAVLDKCHESLLKAVKTSEASRAEKIDEIREGLLSIQSSGDTS